MANQPKSYRKFLAGSVTAALVASAVAPAASAAVSFTDLKDDAHKENILKAVEMNLINGYDDNTFRPYNEISRGSVVKIISRYLDAAGVEVDTTGVDQFEDVKGTGDTELPEAALKVRAKGIFVGSNDKLDPADTITREEMATVLTRTFDHLVDRENVESKVTDIEAAYPVHQDNINIISEWGVTDQEVFDPKGDVKRAQFVTFMIRAIEAATPSVEASDIADIKSESSTSILVSINGNVESVEASDFAFDNGLEVISAEIVQDPAAAAEVTYVRLTTSEQVEGQTYNLTSFMGTEVVTGVVPPVVVPVVTPEVTEVSAIDAITVTEGGEVTLPEVVGVTYSDDSTEEVAVSWDTAELDVETPGTYTLTGTIEGTDLTASVDVVVENVLEIAEVTAVNTTTVEVEFDGAVDADAIEDLSLYAISPELDVTKAELKKDTDNVVVLTLGDTTFGLTTYTLTVTGLTDVALTSDFLGTNLPEIKVDSASLGGDRFDQDGYSVSANRGGNITVDFNLDVVSTSLSVNTVKLYDVTAGNYVAIAAPTLGASASVSINPVSDLAANHVYRVELDGVKVENSIGSYDVPAQNMDFIIGDAVTISGPSNGTIAVDTKDAVGNDLLVATYTTGALDADTINAETVRLYKVTSPVDTATYSYDVTDERVENNSSEAVETTLVEGNVVYDAARKKITFVPTDDLDGNAEYVFVIEGVKNTVGIKSATVSDAFSTAATEVPQLANVVSEDKDGDQLDLLSANTDVAVTPNLDAGSYDFYLNFDSAIAKGNDFAVELYDVTDGVYVSLAGSTIDILDRTSITTLDELEQTITDGRLGVDLGTNLDYGHEYKVIVRGLEADNANATAVGTVEFDFTTDFSRPTVSKFYQDTRNDDNALGVATDWTEVKDGATNLKPIGGGDVDGKFVFKFSENIDYTTRSAIKVYDVTANNADVTSAVAVTVGANNTANADYVTINDETLKDGHKYRVVIGKDVKDADGNSFGEDVSYTFVIGDGPTVSDTNIEYNADNVTGLENYDSVKTGIKVDSDIKVTFGLDSDGTDFFAIDKSTVNADTVYLKNTATGEKVAATLTTSGTDNKVVTINPSEELSQYTSYTLVVSGVKDAAGNKVSAISKSFVTEQIATVSTNIENGATVAADSKVAVTFNKSIGNVTADDDHDVTDGRSNAALSDEILVTLVKLDADGNPDGTTDIDLSGAVKKVPATNSIELDLAQLTSDQATSNVLEEGASYKLIITDEQTVKLGLENDKVEVKFTVAADTTAPGIDGFYSSADGSLDSNDLLVTNNATNIPATNNLIVKLDSKDLTAGSLKLNVFDVTTQSYVVQDHAVDASQFTVNSSAVAIDLTDLNGSTAATPAISADHKYVFTFTDGEDESENVMATSTITLTFDEVATPFALLKSASINGGTDIAANLNNKNKGYTATNDVLVGTAAAGDADIALNFNDTVNYTNAEIVLKKADGTVVSTTTAWTSDGSNLDSVLTVTPKAALDERTDYVLTVKGVKDLAGNTTPDRTVKFTTDGYIGMANAEVQNDAGDAIANGATVTAANAASFSLVFDNQTSSDDGTVDADAVDLTGLTTSYINEYFEVTNLSTSEAVTVLNAQLSLTSLNDSSNTSPAGTDRSEKETLVYTSNGTLKAGNIYEITLKAGFEDANGKVLQEDWTIQVIVTQ
ncbi:Ig-like domain-containing protein [Bacillus sp. AK031]